MNNEEFYLVKMRLDELRRERDFYLRQLEEMKALADESIRRAHIMNNPRMAIIKATDIYHVLTGDMVPV